MRIISKKIAGTLRQYGYKLTPQRQVIIQTIASRQDHLTPAALYAEIHQDHPNIGFVTVYRTLELLAKLGLICRVHAGGNCRSYLMRRPSEHHHHLICSNCGRVVDFTDCDLGEVEQRLSHETGFDIDDHLLEFIGLCQVCQQN